MNEPLDAVIARATVRRIVRLGSVTFTEHARDAMRDDGLEQIDVLLALRGGWVEEAEWENGAFRYRVRTQSIVVVIELEYDDESAVEKAEELVVITVWGIR